ncbi:hypothetical protein D6817_02145 [Candidatus Pacearchaeota archaeon]|nr:MAG: hypothetical protein D6817_02145 [Candidatus Pacearchaeota archaeon]
MDKYHKVVMALLVLAIVFSIISLIVSLGIFSLDLPKSAGTSARVTDSGAAQVKFVVEPTSANSG